MSGIIREPGCDRFADSYDLFALGSLEEQEAGALAGHLQAGCAYCASQLQRALTRTQAISQTVPLVDPPARLRRRFAASIGAEPASRTNRLPWTIAVAASLALAALSLWNFRTFRSLHPSSPAPTDSHQFSSMLEILAAPGTIAVPLVKTTNPRLQGALYVHKKLGLAMVVNGLPAPPSGWIYESWITPKTGAPRPIESLQTDLHGQAVTVLKGPVDVDRVSALLISMEPVGSAISKPTTLVFDGRVKQNG